MSETLTERIEALESSGVDYSDPKTYADLLGYGEEGQEDQPAAAEVQGETKEPAAQAEPPAQENSAAPAAAEEVETEAAGIATKDGKRVIPFAVLQDTRNKANELAKTVERLQRELEAKQAGTTTAKTDAQAAADASALSDEDLSDIEADFPAVAKLAQAYKALQAQVTEVKTASQKQADATQATADVDLQALIDERPLLSKWQARGGAAWAEAVALDKELQADAQWANKPMAQRFEEVERRIAEDFGIQIAKPAPAPAPKTGPAKAAEPVATTVTPTLTDFNGRPAAVGDPMADMPVGKMVDTAMNMDMESLRRMAGLSY